MKESIITVQNISKQYRLGLVGSGTLKDDLTRLWYSLRRKESPFLKVGDTNAREEQGQSDYVWALRDINFEVKRGEVLGIIGKNGAGKSTLLKILSRVTAPTTGVIKSKGRIASLLEVGTGFHPELTGRENIYLNGAILGMTKMEVTSKLDEIIEFSGCQRYIDTPTKRYSSGMTVRLAFAVAAHLEPEILVVDEVLAVGDAEFQKKAIGKMQDISQGEGRTVLFVSHNMSSVRNLCSRCMLLKDGKVEMVGETSAIVDYYLYESKEFLSSKIKFDKKELEKKEEQEVIIESIEISNGSIVEGDLIELILRFKRKDRLESVSISGTILGVDQRRIGSFFSNEINVSENSNKLTFQVDISDLAPGTYGFNIGVNSGNVHQNNLRMLDSAYGVLFFERIFKGEERKAMKNWKNTWGDIQFKSQITGN
ncbi:ABC transporter ATP-binding protein [Croceiramulus getboli]|nr:ABC transporter ATP-binding protein [Flavobacteriaceae bacterium YJPT1-3]